MTTFRTFLMRSGARHGRPALLLALLLSLFSSLALAQSAPGGGPGPNDPTTNASSPGEEVTSLPFANDAAGLTLVGSLRELRGLGLRVQGSGRIDVMRLDRRTFAVTFVGDYRLGVDRAVLAASPVRVLFRGGAPFQGGVAILTILGTPTALSPDRVPLPLARLAGAQRMEGNLLTLDALGRRQRAFVSADFTSTHVTLTQRSTL